MKHSKTNNDLLKDLKEQMQFLRTSSLLYDKGVITEAKRLALAIRILVHDTEKSTSLLKSIGVKDTIRYYNNVPASTGNTPVTTLEWPFQAA